LASLLMYGLVSMLVIVALAFFSFIVTYFLTPVLIRRLERNEILGVDLHKANKPKVPEMGGLVMLIGFTAAATLCGFLSLNVKFMLGIILTATLGAMIGIVDDIIPFSKKAHVILTLFIGVPIITFRCGSTLVYLTPWGSLDLGLLFWLIVPFVTAFMTNGVNIYAGFNGLEAGLGLITSVSLGICALLYGSIESTVSLFILAGTLLAFLKWNVPPAKVLPGNCGSYLIGAVISASIIVGTMKAAGIIACFPYIINFLLRARDRFRWTVGETTPEGLVYSRRINALWALFMHRKPVKEFTVVRRCWLVQASFGVSAILLSYFHVMFVAPLLFS